MNELALSYDKKISKGKLAIIDIGSNSIRLVIYPQNGKYPFPLFNERINCKLGDGLTSSQKMSSQSISKALSAIKRFAYIIRTMSVDHQLIVATAAIRRAKNAKEFLRPAEKLLNNKIRTLSAKEEAHYAYLGVLSNMGIHNGLVADLGGGSLELILINDGKKIKSTSLDIGHLSQLSYDEINAEISKVEWLNKSEGLRLYGTGGSFRALGSAYIKNYDYPLQLLHGLKFKSEQATTLLDKMSDDGEMVIGIPPGRLDTISTAANIMISLVLRSSVKDIMISGTSIRDGLIAELNEENRVSPDKVAYYKVLAKNQRFNGMQTRLKKIFKSIFKKIAHKDFERAFKISTNLSDIAWDEQPELRGNIASDKILSLPIRDLSHVERVWMANVLYYRYIGTKDKKQINQDVINLLSPKQRRSSFAIGLGLRFLYVFSAGLPKNLDNIKFKIKKNKLVCSIVPEARGLMDRECERKLKSFASACDLNYEIV